MLINRLTGVKTDWQFKIIKADCSIYRFQSQLADILVSKPTDIY